MQSPRNLEGVQFYDIDLWEVAEFHPTRDGKGVPTQVHVFLQIAGSPYPFVMRLKSKRAVTQLVDALVKHRDLVWPEGEQHPDESEVRA